VPETPDRLAESLKDRYAIQRELGRGGMATVYLAEDLRHERRVAIKVFKPELAAVLGGERFLREIQITARLNHPHILPLLDSGDADGLLYYVMPFVEGESLRQRLEREKQLPIADALKIVRDVGDALSYAHSHDIVHRDIKPENILLESGHAVVSDFGIARPVTAAGGDRLTETGVAMGTPTYMSPEQAAGERDVDARSDIYALGCVLYELLAGEPPFSGPSAQAIMARKFHESVTSLRILRPAIPEALERVVTKALDRTPADRFLTAQEMLDAVDRAAQPSTQPSGPILQVINQPPCVTPTHYMNRDEAALEISSFLRDQSKRVLTVVGRAGIGKTSVVCRVLEAVGQGSRIGDQPWPAIRAIVHLNLYGNRRDTVPRMMADLAKPLSASSASHIPLAYDDSPQGIRATMETLLSVLDASQAVILSIDNLEHVIDPRGYVIDRQLDTVLRAVLELPSHALKVITTTRVPPRELILIEPGRQQVVHLDRGLDPACGEQVLRRLDAANVCGMGSADSDRLRRATEYTNGNPRALEALYASLIADRDSSLEDVIGDRPDSLPDNVVRAYVGEAVERLEPAERRVMHALAVLGRPAAAEVVAALVEPDGIGDSQWILSRLVGMHLVRKDRRGYYLHPVDRAYFVTPSALGATAGRTSVDAAVADEEQASKRLVERAAQYFRRIRRPAEEWQSLEDLSVPLAEFEYRVASEDFDGAAEVLTAIGFDYLIRWGHYTLAVDLHEQIAERIDDPQLAQWTIGNLGTAYWRLGQYDRAIACYSKAITMAEARNDPAGRAASLGNLGTCYSELGRISTAMEYHREAVEIQRAIGDTRGEATQISNFGTCQAQLGRLTEARECYETSMNLARELNDQTLVARQLGNLGLIEHAVGDADRGLALLERARNLAEEIGDPIVQIGCLRYRGEILLDRGDTTGAREAFDRAVTLGAELGNPQFEATARFGLAMVLLKEGKPGDARDMLHAALEPHPVFHPPHFVSLWRGMVALRSGSPSQAERDFEEALRLVREVIDRDANAFGAWDIQGLAQAGLAVAQTAPGHAADARVSFARARAIVDAPGIVAAIRSQFDEIAIADVQGLLRGVLG